LGYFFNFFLSAILLYFTKIGLATNDESHPQIAH